MISLIRIPIWFYYRTQQAVSEKLDVIGIQPDLLFIEITNTKPIEIKSLSATGQNNQSWFVRCNKKEYKLFYLSYDQYSEQIKQLTNCLHKLGLVVPKFIGSDKNNKYVVSEWVRGAEIKPSDVINNPEILKKIAKLQAITNSTDDCVTSIRHEDFFFLNDIIIPRYLYWISVRFGKRFRDVNKNIIAALQNQLVKIKNSRKLVVTNPDFSLNNLVLTDKGDIVVIDTEFLSIDYGADLELANFLNKLKNISTETEGRYIKYYEKYRSLDQFHQEREFWDACVLMKHLGKQAKYLRTDENYLRNSINKLEEVFCGIEGRRN